MAEIRSFPVLRHLRAEPTSHVVFFKRGAPKRSGAGLSFWFGPLGASIAEVPLEDRDIAFHVQGRSADFQDVHVNGVVTFRVVDANLLAQRVDFSIDTKTGRFRGEPLDKLTGVVVQLVQQLVTGLLGRAALASILADGVDVIRTAIEQGLALDAGLSSLGLGVVATRVASVKPSAEVEKALQMPARERIQQAADEATFARRALAVEKERAIQQNELGTKIDLARREEQLIAQRGQNEKKRIVDQTEAEAIAVAARLRNERLAAEGEADGIRLREGARVDTERDRIAIYRELPPAAMMGLAAHELAGKLQKIEHLSLSPDMLGTLLERVLGAQARNLENRN
jgi:regulator of protease activity HflC (stomatin/prohibitin superfamily)